MWFHHVRALQALSAAEEPPASDMERTKRATLAETIIKTVASAFARHRIDVDGILSWSTSLKSSNLLPSLDRKCWVKSDRAVVQDDDDLYRMFKPALEKLEDLTVISSSSCGMEELAFFDQVEIRRLSNCVQARCIAQGSRPASHRVAAWIQHLIFALQLFVRTQEPELYETMGQPHRKRLQAFSVVEAEELSIVRTFVTSNSALSNVAADLTVTETDLILIEEPFVSVNRSAVNELIDGSSRDLPPTLCSSLASLILGYDDFKSHKFLQSHWRDSPSEITYSLRLQDVSTDELWKLRAVVEVPEHERSASLESEIPVDPDTAESSIKAVAAVAVDMEALPAWASTPLRERPTQPNLEAANREPPLPYDGHARLRPLQDAHGRVADGDSAGSKVAPLAGTEGTRSSFNADREVMLPSSPIDGTLISSPIGTLSSSPIRHADAPRPLFASSMDGDTRSYLRASFEDIRSTFSAVQRADAALTVLTMDATEFSLADAGSFPEVDAHAVPTDAEAIGRLGEERIVAFLRKTFKYVEWVNENEESGLPFDVRVRNSDDSLWQLVECKATVSPDIGVRFHVSPREVCAAVECREHYSVFFVNLKLGTLRKLDNFASMLSSEALQLLVTEPSV